MLSVIHKWCCTQNKHASLIIANKCVTLFDAYDEQIYSKGLLIWHWWDRKKSLNYPIVELLNEQQKCKILSSMTYLYLPKKLVIFVCFFQADLSGNNSSNRCRMLRGTCAMWNLLTEVLQLGQHFRGFFYHVFWWLGQLATVVTFRRVVLVSNTYAAFLFCFQLYSSVAFGSFLFIFFLMLTGRACRLWS